MLVANKRSFTSDSFVYMNEESDKKAFISFTAFEHIAGGDKDNRPSVTIKAYGDFAIELAEYFGINQHSERVIRIFTNSDGTTREMPKQIKLPNGGVYLPFTANVLRQEAKVFGLKNQQTVLVYGDDQEERPVKVFGDSVVIKNVQPSDIPF